MLVIKVIKRDKNKEDYDANKIQRVVKIAGLTDDQASELAQKITDWLIERNKPLVTSVQIRDKVLVEIQKVNQDAADKLIWYEKYKDKYYGVKF